ncbi:MAG: phosphoadenosine phosphosulfate reductase family protein [Candidatus Thorarchaeota archaeon]
MRFYWCDECNVPRIAETECATCGQKSREVNLSPPGDPFPAMEGHIERAIKTIDMQYGTGVGVGLLPPDKTIVMNKVSSLDAMYEIIVDGFVVGRLRFDIPKRDYSFLLTIEGGRRIGKLSKMKWVSVHDGVLPYLKDGANLMLPGIAGCDSDIQKDDDVWLVDSDGKVIGVGISRMSGTEMATHEKGFAIKIRDVGDPIQPTINLTTATWDSAVSANQTDLEIIEAEAISFIKRTVARDDIPVVVGFSGGKDSLVAYLLVEKALDESPPLFFMNTGIELPETIEHIVEFAKSREARIIGQDAGDRFWESVDTFGSPARDFRWCCKVLKLGPAATSIAEEMGGETLTFMGQRKLESFQRSIEPRVTSNPWVPGQTSANPIQNWNALEVWLYIFREKVPFNPLYNQGYHRMGCYLCPSSPLEEFERLSRTHPELYDRLMAKLHEQAKLHGFPEEWVELGFWRWKNIPKGQMELIKKLGLSIEPERTSPRQKLELNIVKGVSPCASSGFSLEGQFTGGLDLNMISRLMPIFGETKFSEELGALRTKRKKNTITLFNSGSMVIRGEDEAEIERLSRQVERTIHRAMFCQACGSCVPQCEHGALSLENDRILADKEKCTTCLNCDKWPCPTYLS